MTTPPAPANLETQGGSPSATPPWSDYAVNAYLNDGATGVVDAIDNERTLVSITDGTSNTIFFGHRNIYQGDYLLTTAKADYMNTPMLGGSNATAIGQAGTGAIVATAFTPTLQRDPSGIGPTPTTIAAGQALATWGSPFAQGCLFCMGDATVRMFPYALTQGPHRRRWSSGRLPGGLLHERRPGCREPVTLPDTW